MFYLGNPRKKEEEKVRGSKWRSTVQGDVVRRTLTRYNGVASRFGPKSETSIIRKCNEERPTSRRKVSVRNKPFNGSSKKLPLAKELFIIVLLSSWDGVKGFRTLDYPTFSAVVGHKVDLPCNVTPPTVDDDISLVLWYRGDSGSPIYSLDARTTSADQATHFASEVLGSRAYFNLTIRPAALQITPLKEEDAAEYRCRVDFKRARTKNRVMKLIIITPPKGIAIKTPANRTVTGTIGPYDEGSPLHLICEAVGGKPPPAVTWWKESTLMDEKFEISSVDRLVLNELILPKLQRTDLMSTLTCQASNTNLTVPLSSKVSVDMNLKPQDVRIITPFQPLSSGRKIEISCHSTGSKPEAKISWWRERDELEGRESYSTDRTTTINTLVFSPSSVDNGKKLVCRAENINMDNSTVESSWTLNVFYRPQLTLALGASIQHAVIAEGSEVYFECNIQANPPVTSVEWFLEGEQLTTDRNSGIVINNNSLVIKDIKRQHRGNYQCKAKNTEGEGESEEVMLHVKFAPVCKGGQKTQYGVARHEAETITCDVDADPTEVKFSWRFNDSYENTDVLFSSLGTTSYAQWTPRRMEDYGALLCWGTNEVGTQIQPCVFFIVPAGPPDAVENCSVLNQTSTTLYLVCESGYDGGLPQQFHLEVYSLTPDDLQANVTTLDEPVFYARDLPPGSSFELVVYASNPKGRGPSVRVAATTLFSAKRRVGETPAILVSPVLAVLLGIVGLLVLLAIIIILIMKKRAQEEADETAEQVNSEKLQGPLTVEKEMRMDGGDDRCPDIIPPNNYITAVADGRIYENLRSEKEPTYENIIKRVHFKTKESEGELTYAELILPSSCDLRMIRRDEPPTEYADINFQPNRGLQHPLQQQQHAASNTLREDQDARDSSVTSLMCNKCYPLPPPPPPPLELDGYPDEELRSRSPSM